MADEHWTIFVAPLLSSEPAIEAAIEDLQREGDKHGIEFQQVDEPPQRLDGVILVGSPADNPTVSLLVEQGTIRLDPPSSPQGYQIRTLTNAGGGQTIVVASASQSVAGHANGLYWLWDRLRVSRRIPVVDCRREPVGPVCLTAGRSETDIRNALRFGATWVSGGNILDLVPWEAEPEASLNRQHRQQLKQIIDLAHTFGLKYLAVGDEMSFHPEFLEKMQARLDPADPRLWQAQ